MMKMTKAQGESIRKLAAGASTTPTTPDGGHSPCSGCGGEKFDPPNTPADIEQLLREQVSP